MRWTPWAAYLWPGLPQVWSTGRWPGLVLAVGFALLLNLGLASSLVWCELLTPGVRGAVWLLVLTMWGGAWLFSSRASGCAASPGQIAQAHDRFPEAIHHYLKGNWFEAERLLNELLRSCPHDVDAGLTLATLLRHTGRREEAAEQLDRMERLEGSAKWQWEIAGERQRLRELAEPPASTTADGRASEPTPPVREAA